MSEKVTTLDIKLDKLGNRWIDGEAYKSKWVQSSEVSRGTIAYGYIEWVKLTCCERETIYSPPGSFFHQCIKCDQLICNECYLRGKEEKETFCNVCASTEKDTWELWKTREVELRNQLAIVESKLNKLAFYVDKDK